MVGCPRPRTRWKLGTVRLLIDFAAGVGGFYSYVLLVAYVYDNRWKEAVGLYALSFATIFLSAILLAVIRKRIFIFWMICIPAFYVSAVYLTLKLSWFGYVSQH